MARKTLILSALLLGWPCIAAPPDIRFVCTIPTNSPAFAAGETLYRQVFQQLGYNFSMEFQPARRAQVELEAGRYDGDCGRILGFVEKDQPMPVLRIDIPLTTVDAIALTYDQSLLSLSRQQLNDAGLRFGYIRGNLSVEREITQTRSIIPVGVLTPSQGIRMLSSKRIDVFVFPNILLDTALAKANPKLPPAIWGSWQTYALYPYFHNRHRALAPAFTQTLSNILDKSDNPIAPYQQ